MIVIIVMMVVKEVKNTVQQGNENVKELNVATFFF